MLFRSVERTGIHEGLKRAAIDDPRIDARCEIGKVREQTPVARRNDMVGNSLTDNSWFDASGHTIKQLPAGSSRFTKISYDSLGRATVRYSGYDLDETSYSEAGSVTDDTIMEQAETAFDNAGNAIQQTVRQRYHNAAASQLGALQNPSTTPKARVTYVEIGRAHV